MSDIVPDGSTDAEKEKAKLAAERETRERIDRAAKEYAANLFSQVLLVVAFAAGLYYASREAYNIRLYAIKTFGKVIHEFDPWFNFRATKYLADNGWHAFFHWFDYESWYPLGRPVGTTIYPGMQITSVAIWKAMKATMKKGMSLNDVCVFVPAWFGVSATCFLGLLTAECSNSYASGAVAAGIMSIVPAHLMRSVGGGYDNESIALTAMCATFYCWTRSLRHDPKVTDGRPTRDSIVWGVLCGLAYIYMVAAWGGFVFVVNMVGAHAASLFFLGRCAPRATPTRAPSPPPFAHPARPQTLTPRAPRRPARRPRRAATRRSCTAPTPSSTSSAPPAPCACPSSGGGRSSRRSRSRRSSSSSPSRSSSTARCSGASGASPSCS